MRVTTSKSKNAESFYISKGYVNDKGVSTSVIIRKLGTLKDLLPEHGPTRDDVMVWAKEQARIETLKYKREKEEKNPLVADPADHAFGHRADLRRCAGRCLRRHHGVCAQSRVHLRGHGAESAGLQPALRHHGSPDLRQPKNRRTGARLH